MAKLNPTDPEFGIPVAARIRQELAIRFNKEAGLTNKTLSRYISEYIEKAVINEKEIKELTSQLVLEKQKVPAAEKKLQELQIQLDRERELTKRVVGKFIMQISEGEEKSATKYIRTFNTIFQDEKSK